MRAAPGAASGAASGEGSETGEAASGAASGKEAAAFGGGAMTTGTPLQGATGTAPADLARSALPVDLATEPGADSAGPADDADEAPGPATSSANARDAAMACQYDWPGPSSASATASTTALSAARRAFRRLSLTLC